MIEPIILEAKPLKERFALADQKLDDDHLANSFTKIIVFPFTLKYETDFLMCVAHHRSQVAVGLDSAGRPAVTDQEVIAFPKELLFENMKFFDLRKGVIPEEWAQRKEEVI